MENLSWRVAKLLPPSMELFTTNFYPKPNKLGNSYVWYAILPGNHQNKRVVVVSNLHHKQRMAPKVLTAQLAVYALEDTTKSIPPEDLACLRVLEEYPGVIFNFKSLSQEEPVL